ncbi:hypothetical protein ABW20_dc0108405 [Dactylellina cionopaga]|nr:hypothetical protein ABW20_dc0108405 [Dactylellina cionopaga]
MQLSKINLIRKHASSKYGTPTLFSTDKKTIGTFWYIKEELDEDKARKIARSKQVDGYRGDIFYGSAEKLWKKTRAQKDIRGSPSKRSSQTHTLEALPENFIGRSYGLLSDEEGDEDIAEKEDEYDSEEQSGGLCQLDNQISSQQSYLSSVTQIDPLSPPLSPTPTRDSALEANLSSEEHTPPMPGSFIFEDDAPVSPAFSSSLTESIQNIPDFLFSTPNRPSYVNPGLALENRYDSSSPLPQHAKFDMTPRQLAAFSRRKQEIERLMERPTTALSDTGTDDWNISEKDRSERERRRKDLQKFRLERQKRLRLESRSEGSKIIEHTRKRSRDISEPMDLESQLEESMPKKSRSSEIFARALDTEHRRDSRTNVTEPKSTPSNDARGRVPSPTFANKSQPDVIMEELPPPNLVGQPQEDPYGAPTPSPSPPFHTENLASKHAQPHIPKVPSGLRKAVNISSSPATSPSKGPQPSRNPLVQKRAEENESRTRSAVASILRSSFLTFDFPPLMASFATKASPSLVDELSNYFQATVA